MKKNEKLITQVLMIGVDQNTPGGMAAVVKTYSLYFRNLKYISTWKVGNYFTKLFCAIRAVVVAFLYLIIDRNIRIIHIHAAANASFYRKSIFVRIGKFFKKKVILHMHAADFIEFFNNSQKQGEIIKTISACDRLVVLSQYWKTYFENIGINGSMIEILNNIIPPPIDRIIESDDMNIKLLFLGEIGKRKGIYDILEVLHKDITYFKNRISFRIGGNLEELKLIETIERYKLTDFVKFEGWVKGDKKNECLNWADIFILPSYNEGLPIAILESMSYGLPIISTKVGGIPEILLNHQNGILISPGNLEEIDNALRFFIENKHKIAEYGANARETINGYRAEVVIEKLNQLYKSLIQQKD